MVGRQQFASRCKISSLDVLVKCHLILLGVQRINEVYKLRRKRRNPLLVVVTAGHSCSVRPAMD